VVLVIVILYAGGLLTALSMRKPVLARVAPDRSVMYRVGADGRIYNRFRYTLANRGKAAVSVPLSTRGLTGAEVSLAGVSLRPGDSVSGEFEISAPAVQRPDVVTHFSIIAGDETIPMTFLAPTEGK
jgi:hypothetical protein